MLVGETPNPQRADQEQERVVKVESAKRTKAIKIRVSESELADLKSQCNLNELATWIREKALRKNNAVIETQIADQKLIHAVAQIGNNLNQIARKVNANQMQNSILLLAELAEIRSQLNEILNSAS